MHPTADGHGAPTSDHEAGQPATAPSVEEYIERVVGEAPELTAEQRGQLSTLLAPRARSRGAA